MKHNLTLAIIKKNIFSLGLAIFVVIIILFSLFIYSNAKANILNENKNAFSDRVLTLESVISKNTHITLMLKSIFDLYINENISQSKITTYQQTLPAQISYFQNKNYHVITPKSRIGSFKVTNSIFASGIHNTINKTYLQQLNAVLHMQDFQKSAQQNNNSLIASYYMHYTKSGDNFISIYPPININKIVQAFDNMKEFINIASQVYDEFSPPEVNPKRNYFLTEPYFDRAGNGMMVSCAIPTYQNNHYSGVIGVDITLGFLNEFIKKSPSLQGGSFIISPKGYIINGTNVKYKKESDLLLFNDLLVKLGGSDKFFIFKNSLSSAPWQFVYVVSKRALLRQILTNTRYYNLFFVISLLTAFISYFYIRKYFVLPSIIAEDNLIKSNQDLNNIKIELEKNLLDLKNAQQKIVESEKLASLGTLVTGVAHEINTPMGVAITANSLVLEKLVALQQLFNENKLTKDKLKSFLAIMQKSSTLLDNNLERIAELVKDFKAISASTQEYQLSCFNFKEYLYELLHVHKHLFKDDDHQIDIKCNNIIIKSYKDIFNQIIITLIDNSIRHGFKQRMNGLINIEFNEYNDHYQLSYSDNGCGIKDIEKNKVFDPFYTSGRGQGKGLGLFAIHNIIKETLHGDITITETKIGICFIITWPKKNA